MNLQVLEKGLVPIYSDENAETLINGRELHEFLGSKRQFADWIKDRIEKYSFIENEDFYIISQICETSSGGGTVKKEYILKIDTAKEIAMVENNSKGRQVRKYFIEAEKRFKSNHIDFEKLSPELRMFANVFTSLAKIELEQNETKKLAQQAQEGIKDIKNTIITESANWRKDVVNKIRAIAREGSNYQELQKESYKLLEDKAGCNLKLRVENMKMRALTNGMCQSKVDKINTLDVIEEDKRLKEIYVGIVNKMYLKYK